MMLLERARDGWKIVHSSWPVVYGDSGMAWGLGLHSTPRGKHIKGGHIKREGDRCSPAGIFELGIFCGYDTAAPAGVRYPYLQSTATLRWVDDPKSRYYNMMIDEAKIPKELNGAVQWRSAETMKFDGIDYTYVIFVKHNSRRIPGKGSCIFLHLNSPERTPTAGCTAMDEEDMLVLLHWIVAKKKPLLVQLPLSEYEKRRRLWGLPLLPADGALRKIKENN